MKFHVSLLLSCFALSLAACSQKKDSGDSCQKGVAPTPSCAAIDYTSLDSAPVSFKTDLFPRLQSGCASPFCHAAEPGSGASDLPAGTLYLGPELDKTPADPTPKIAMVLAGLAMDSKTAPSMKRVLAGDPANSFVMLKLTGCQGSVTGCTAQKSNYTLVYSQGCGDTMPPACDTTDWTAADTQLFARWIKQGAADN